MLVSLYRSGPLRQRIAKGYTAVGRPGARTAPAQLVDALLARPPQLPRLPGGEPALLRADPRTPGALWVDTGRVSLHDPGARAAVAAGLAESVAVVARSLRKAGALLVPAGWSPAGAGAEAGAGPAVLPPDVHSLEVVSEVQRELLCNLVREHSACLIALTGRQLYGPAGAAAGGSARLSRAADQVAARYVASFAPQHLDRVRTVLRQEERLARLEAMDVNPLGEPGVGAQGDVSLRLVDGQVSVSSALAHALLVQALGMKARELERSGRRIGAVPQALIERNRARAIAHGLAAGFEIEQKEPRGKGRPVGRRGPEAPRIVPANRAALQLLTELLPYFRQLDATADELGQLFNGLELAAGSGSGGAGPSAFVRNENDLLARWRSYDPRLLDAERLAEHLGNPGWLVADHIGEANRALGAGSSAAARVWLTELLAPSAPAARTAPAASTARNGSRPHGGPGARTPSTTPPRQHDPRQHDPRQADPRQADPRQTDPSRQSPKQQSPKAEPGLAEKRLLDLLARPGLAPEEILPALRSYCRAGTALDLNRTLRTRDREEAKATRRLLRPEPARRVRLDAPPSAWDDERMARAVRAATEAGTALLHWDVPAADRHLVRTALRALGRPPHDLRHVLLTDTTYTAKADERRGTVEVLLVAPGEEPAR
ncbi:hypothetical protein ACGFZP_33855 [Kitasatospora sp. NPDC048239]|uniref:hypothetical protein n=1 Tax=Kitasatospora sp. NPDC048239 TaxID=3364046 RepID=UPI003714CE45